MSFVTTNPEVLAGAASSLSGIGDAMVARNGAALELLAKELDGKAYPTDLTDPQADEIVHQATQFQSQRAELLNKYYGQVKGAVGADTAARFFEAESQLAALTDLQRASKLPAGE